MSDVNTNCLHKMFLKLERKRKAKAIFFMIMALNNGEWKKKWIIEIWDFFCCYMLIDC